MWSVLTIVKPALISMLLSHIYLIVMIQCSKCLSKKLTLVLSGTRELNRKLFYKLVYLI